MPYFHTRYVFCFAISRAKKENGSIRGQQSNESICRSTVPNYKETPRIKGDSSFFRVKNVRFHFCLNTADVCRRIKELLLTVKHHKSIPQAKSPD